MLDMNTQMRLTGLASGLDTDQLVQNMGRAHFARIDAVKRDRQLTLWRQEAFRSTINMALAFQRSNLNVANPASNMRSAAAFAKFTYNLSIKGSTAVNSKDIAAGVLSVTATGDLKNFNQKVDAVAQLASRETWTGSKANLQGVTSNGFDLNRVVSGGGVAFNLSIDGTTKMINIGGQMGTIMGATGPRYIQAEASSTELVYDSIDLNHFVDNGSGTKISIKEHLLNNFPGELSSLGINNIGDAGWDTLAHTQISNWLKDGDGNHIQIFSTDESDALPLQRTMRYFYGDANKVESQYFLSGGSHVSVIDFLKNSSNEKLQEWGLDGIDFENLQSSDLDAINNHFNNIGTPRFVDNPAYNADASTDAFVEALNNEITKQFGNDYKNIVTITDNGELNFHKPSSTVAVFAIDGGGSFLANLGFPSTGAVSGTFNDKSLSDLFGDKLGGAFKHPITGAVSNSIVINNTVITINETDTLSSVMSRINSSAAGVTLSYDSSADRFVLQNKTEGSASRINADYFANELFAALGIVERVAGEPPVVNSTYNPAAHSAVGREEGKNLIAVINGQEFIRQTNTFTHEGMTFTFHSTYNVDVDPTTGSFRDDVTGKIKMAGEPAISVDVSKNTTELVDSIKSFVDEYNKLLEQINAQITQPREKSNGSHLNPLTDDERKAMSEEDIKLYEAKAKIGLTRSDSDLRRMADQLRSAIYQKVDGVGLTMRDIGITTAPHSWTDGGKLIIDETALQNAIENNYDEVVALFTKSSSIPAGNAETRGARSSESGIAQRINDILNDAVGTVNGRKGYLLQKAGIENDATNMDNALTKQILRHDSRIATLLERWYRQESTYYKMFARMETAMSRMVAQQNNLAAMLAQNSGG